MAPKGIRKSSGSNSHIKTQLEVHPSVPRYIKAVKYLPWKGHNYGKSTGMFKKDRILVLGESHYNWRRGEIPRNHTTDAIRNYINENITYKRRHGTRKRAGQFFANIALLLNGQTYNTGGEIKFLEFSGIL